MQQTGRRLCDSQRMKLHSGQLLFLGLQESTQLSHPEIKPFPCTTHRAETDTWHSAAKGTDTRHHCAMSCSARELPSCVLWNCHSSPCTVQQSGLQHMTVLHEKLGSPSITMACSLSRLLGEGFCSERCHPEQHKDNSCLGEQGQGRHLPDCTCRTKLGACRDSQRSKQNIT